LRSLRRQDFFPSQRRPFALELSRPALRFLFASCRNVFQSFEASPDSFDMAPRSEFVSSDLLFLLFYLDIGSNLAPFPRDLSKDFHKGLTFVILESLPELPFKNNFPAPCPSKFCPLPEHNVLDSALFPPPTLLLETTRGNTPHTPIAGFSMFALSPRAIYLSLGTTRVCFLSVYLFQIHSFSGNPGVSPSVGGDRTKNSSLPFWRAYFHSHCLPSLLVLPPKTLCY